MLVGVYDGFTLGNDADPLCLRCYERAKEMLVSWDLEDDDGKVIPIEAEAVKAALVPDWLLSETVTAIRADMTMDGDSKND